MQTANSPKPRIAVTRGGDRPADRKRFMAAKHTPQNERPTNTNKIAAPGGVTAMRGGFALIPRKEALQKTFGKWGRVSRALLRNTLPTIGDCSKP
jgi:hypothetical protein